jgi:hypothetical protein
VDYLVGGMGAGVSVRQADDCGSGETMTRKVLGKPRSRTRAALLVPLLTLGARGARAQPSVLHGPARVPVAVVLADSSFTSGPSYRVIRRATSEPRDLLLLGREADVSSLSAAVRELLVLRQLQGDTVAPGDQGELRLRARDTAIPRDMRLLAWGQRVLDDVRRAPMTHVTGVGTVRMVTIWLPAQSRRRSARR